MLSASMLVLAAACISSPLEPEETATPAPEEQEQPTDPGEDTNPLVLHVSPTSIELDTGESQDLSVWLDDPEIDLGEATFTTSATDPDVVEIVVEEAARVRVTARQAGAADIELTATLGGSGSEVYEQEQPITVTVVDDPDDSDYEPPADQSVISSVLGVPDLESMWSGLAYTPTYDGIFGEWGDTHWDRSGGKWEQTYYDRGFAWYAAWWRTGDDSYLQRGHTDVIAYRDDYVLPNNGAVPPRWANPEGLAMHYALTGDTKSGEALARLADKLAQAWMDNMLTTSYQDGRIQGRTVLATLMAHLVEAPAHRDWEAETRRGVDNLIEWFETSGGDGSWDMKSYCGGQANFQVAHALVDVLIRYYDTVETDPRIPGIVRRSLDHMWNWWQDSGQGLSYLTVNCDNGSTNAAPDLNLLSVWPFGWYYEYSGDPDYRTRGDKLFEGGLEKTFWSGDKQFNQSFMRSWRYPYHTR